MIALIAARMDGPRFEPTGAVEFDLARGLVRLEGAEAAVVPIDALAALCAAAGAEPCRAFGGAIGRALGERIRARVSPRGASVEAVAEQLAGELALIGLGRLGVEQWGRALVLVVDGGPLGATGDAMTAAALEGALGCMTDAPVRIVCLERDGARARFLATGEAGARSAEDELRQGRGWAEVLVRLHPTHDDAPGGPSGGSA